MEGGRDQRDTDEERHGGHERKARVVLVKAPLGEERCQPARKKDCSARITISIILAFLLMDNTHTTPTQHPTRRRTV
jgi:hypothetical protein